MKVLCLLGSPRPRGNSAALLSAYADQAQALGAEVARHSLNDLDFKPCQACFACKTTSEVCVLKDELTPILAAVRDCDVLALASPVYFGDLSAQLKAFVDRSFSLLTPDYARGEKKTRLAPGKAISLLLAQGHPNAERFTDIIPRYAYFFRLLGFTSQFPVRAVGVYAPGEALGTPHWLEAAAQAARQALGAETPALT